MIVDMTSRRGRAGFTLIELMTVVSLGAILLGLALYSLRPGASKTSTLALAAALSDNFRAARQLAIARGYPVAVGFSNKGSQVANATFQLEGWNVARVTSSVGYSGDYPRLGLAAAAWSGAAVDSAVTPPPLAKFGAFNLDSWLPSKHKNDSILCFTPDGGVISRGFPSVGGRFVALVAIDPVVSAGKLVAGSEPCVVYVSPTGAVEYSKDIPGATLAPGQAVPRSETPDRDEFEGSATITISNLIVRPANGGSTEDAFCTPGEQVTFEIYAYDPEGRQLFAQWKQSGPNGKKGNFGFPNGREGPLKSEVERMEFVESPPPEIEWKGGAAAPPGGCFKARWSWTVPQDSEPGEKFEVTVDVQDATGDATIANPPSYTLQAPMAGRFLAEVRGPDGYSQIVKMNRTGQGRVVLSQPGLEELMPSVDRSGTKLAFLQGPPNQPNNRYVKVRSLSGGGEFTVAGPGRYTSVSISPNGGWVAYRRDDAGVEGRGWIHFKKLGTAHPPEIHSQDFRANGVPLDPIEPDRPGWSPDSKYVVWADGGNANGDIDGAPAFDGQNFGGGRLRVGTLSSSGNVTNIRTLYTATIDRQQVYAPTVFDPGSGLRLLFTTSTSNPVITHIPFRPNLTTYGNAQNLYPCETQSHKIDLNGSNEGTGSGAFDDAFPSVSSNGRKVVLPRLDRPSKRYALIANWKDDQVNFVANPSEKNTIKDEIRSIVWLP